MRYLNTVYVVEHRTKISLSKGSLLVRGPRGPSRVPLEAIDGVVIIGGASMTLNAIAACVERGVRVAVMRRSGALRWVAGPPVSGNVALRRAQHRASDDAASRLHLCRHFVAGKLQNSHRIVRRWARDSDGDVRARLERRADLIAERIGSLAHAPTDNHVRGIEGDAARAHFACLGAVLESAGWRFTERNRRPPRDPVNALLGFSYGLLVTEITGAAEAVGLDPQIGFLHGDRAGRPALALDLAEELRPIADRFVVGVLRRRQLGPEDFMTTPGGAVYLSDTGRRRFFELWEEHKSANAHHRTLGREVGRWALPTIQATLLARHLRGDLTVYPPYVVAA